MDEVCRLCCSTRLVHNSIFDEEGALYLKMSLYLPIKVFQGDGLPQKVCDRCSCRVNDLYQFCNEAIEAQTRLRAALAVAPAQEEAVLVRVKSPSSPPPAPSPLPADAPLKLEPGLDFVKDEPDSDSALRLSDDHSAGGATSDDSEEALLTLSRRKSASRRRRRNNGHADPPLSLAPPHHYYCCTCFTRCDSHSDMILHYKEHAREALRDVPPPTPLPAPGAEGARPTCPRCRQTFARTATLERHVRAHAQRDRRPYRCALCEKTFKEAREILKHSQKHRWRAPEGVAGSGGGGGAGDALDKRFVCDLCPERFVYMRYLVAHRRTAHPDATGPMVHRCVQCVRDFAHLNSLRRHLRSHNGERNFLCNVCGKALTSREHLKYHIRIHTGHKPHVCRTCNKGFVKKCNLTLHERVHSGEKPHVCSHCGKAFSQRSTLVIHERYHSGARPYVCPHCGRGFVARGLLSVHLKTTCI